MYKMSVFTFLLMVFLSCKQKEKPSIPKTNKPEPISYNDTAYLPYRTEDTFGYFSGHIPVKIDRLESPDTSYLFQFLANTVNKNSITLLNNETLSHAVIIDTNRKLRTDTLKNKKTTIVSAYSYGPKESQVIKINGHPMRLYNWSGTDSLMEDIWDINPNSFRHFSFKGTEFYYFRTSIMDLHGGSAANISYHILYNLPQKKWFVFHTCRFEDMLFGDVDGDEYLDYLDFNNSDFCTTVPYSDYVYIQLYSCDKSGDFVERRDKSGQPYYIEGYTGDDFRQDSFTIKKFNWPVALKQ